MRLVTLVVLVVISIGLLAVRERMEIELGTMAAACAFLGTAMITTGLLPEKQEQLDLRKFSILFGSVLVLISGLFWLTSENITLTAILVGVGLLLALLLQIGRICWWAIDFVQKRRQRSTMWKGFVVANSPDDNPSNRRALMLAQITDQDQIALPDAVALNLSQARFCEVSNEDGRIVLTPWCLTDGAARERVPEIIAAAQEWLAKSDREFAAERPLVGSRCLWEAALAALTAVGIRRGCPVATDAELLQLIIALDQDAGGGFEHTAPFGLSRSFRDNADGILHWDDFEFDLCRPSVKRWVANLLELAASGESR